MADDYIDDFVNKQKQKMETEHKEQEEHTRATRLAEENERLIAAKSLQLWYDLRDYIETKVLEANAKLKRERLKFSAIDTDELIISCGVQSVKANYNRANNKIEFSNMIDTAQPWKELVPVVEGGEVKFGKRIAGGTIMPLSFDDITKRLLQSFNE